MMPRPGQAQLSHQGDSPVDTSKTPGEVSHDRRRFLGTAGAAALVVGAAQFGMIGSAKAQTTGATAAGLSAVNAKTNTSFGPVRQINAGVLNVGYVETGPADGQPVILLHGFPYDIHSYVEVAPLLAAEGYRVIVPYFRGHGTTTFLSRHTPRNVDQAAFALDILALMDALKIEKAILAGYDWGTRTVDIIAALWPKRVKALVSVSGYIITNFAASQLYPAKLAWAFWYQYYFDTEAGVQGLKANRYDINEIIWRFNSPTWKFSQATYDQTAAAFNNPDYVPIVIGNYRWRQNLAPKEPEYAALENKLQKAPVIGVPTITIDAKYDPFTPPGDGTLYRDKFSGKYEHRVFAVGHNLPQEAPHDFAKAVVDAGHL
jgi:pimeloyl-ACP methyl ester carboxylesterase